MHYDSITYGCVLGMLKPHNTFPKSSREKSDPRHRRGGKDTAGWLLALKFIFTTKIRMGEIGFSAVV